MGGVSRRQFMAVSALSAGFALGVRPIAASVISTSDAGLVAGEVKIPVADGQIPAYRAMPASGSSLPSVVVVQEIFGVHEHIQDVCRRLAKLGYLAIAPEMFARQGDVSGLSEISEIRKIVAKVPDAQVMADLDATIAWSVQQGLGQGDRVGITGFCWGGRIVWLYSAHNPKIKAGVAWYGRLVGEATPLTPKHPIAIASNLTVPVLGLYGGQDQLIPLETVEQMRQAIAQSPSNSEIVVYPKAAHGFFADYRPSYSPEDAQDAWQRLQAWFQRYGV